ncbi:unnamed protein product [Mytilus edulis]|uniref:AIG1-type G domain-containing protein n=1 Tax=Mytilus edulis TaxID=6550 RepID=A0A8S3RVY0_MYTED|nr:unnamed protein product [Mytilus edulis]
MKVQLINTTSVYTRIHYDPVATVVLKTRYKTKCVMLDWCDDIAITNKCDCLVCKECMTSSHNGHITKEIKSITDIHRQEVDEIINKLKTKVEELTKTLETIDGEHSLLIQSGCDSYIDVVEKTSAEIHQIIDHYKQIEMNTAFDFRDTETHNLKGTRVFFQRLHKESSDRILKFENLLQEPHDNTFFLEWKGLQNEYKIMTEESEQPLASPRQMSGLNQDTFRRAIIDGIDKQFQMGLKELETAVAVLKEEVETLNEKLKGKQEEINNLSEQKETETTVARLTDEIGVLEEKLKMRQEQMEKLSKLVLHKEQETVVARLTEEMCALKEKLKVKQGLKDNPPSGESSDAILVLIGFPGSGKSETGNTVIGKRVFNNEPQQKQETNDVFDLRLTVRDTPGFESMAEFSKIYNSLKDLDIRKVVFGLTIRIGRSDPGFTDTIHKLFRDSGVGEHLSRRTILIFTCVDELLENHKEIYEDSFKKWLRKSEGINQLITSFQLKYCVIHNKQQGANQVKQVEQIVTHIKSLFQNDSELETWCHFNDTVPYNLGINDMDASNERYDEWDVFKGDYKLNQVMMQEIQTTPYKVIELVYKLRPQIHYGQNKIDMIHSFLQESGSHLTERDVDNLLSFQNSRYPICNIS